jgi:multidrug efflux pump subunit AcrA (membrane-fusion protein)
MGFAIAPWTQTVQMTGRVAAIDPQNKPQLINSRIAGRIEKWYVRDGDFVKQNDTIAFISEIKEEYLDTSLVSRSRNQVNAKESSIASYESKINALDKQIDALNQAFLIKSAQIKNKIKQSRFKLSSDSNELAANANQLQVAESQLKRYEDLLNKGLISKTDYENRKIKLQDALAKKLNAENKINTAKNDLLNAELDLNATYQDFNEKLMKVKSEKFSTISLLFESEGSLTKLQNQLSNYSQRSGFYYILAPQDGYIHQMKISGLGGVLPEDEGTGHQTSEEREDCDNHLRMSG